MIITRIETFANDYVALVRVRTDNDDEGWIIIPDNGNYSQLLSKPTRAS